MRFQNRIKRIANEDAKRTQFVFALVIAIINMFIAWRLVSDAENVAISLLALIPAGLFIPLMFFKTDIAKASKLKLGLLSWVATLCTSILGSLCLLLIQITSFAEVVGSIFAGIVFGLVFFFLQIGYSFLYASFVYGCMWLCHELLQDERDLSQKERILSQKEQILSQKERRLSQREYQ